MRRIDEVKSDHAASSKSCPKWKLEQRVQQIKAEKSILFIEARKPAVAESSSTSQVSLSKVVLSAQARSSPPVSHRDICFGSLLSRV